MIGPESHPSNVTFLSSGLGIRWDFRALQVFHRKLPGCRQALAAFNSQAMNVPKAVRTKDLAQMAAMMAAIG